MFVVHSFDKI